MARGLQTGSRIRSDPVAWCLSRFRPLSQGASAGASAAAAFLGQPCDRRLHHLTKGTARTATLAQAVMGC